MDIYVIYQSLTGFSERYAKAIGEKLSIPVYSLAEASTSLTEGDRIIYVSWLFGESIRDLKKVRKIYNVQAICTVGMQLNDEENICKLKLVNGIEGDMLFYMRGGYIPHKITGGYKILMDKKLASLEEELENDLKRNYISQEIEIIKIGADFFDIRNLDPFIDKMKKKGMI